MDALPVHSKQVDALLCSARLPFGIYACPWRRRKLALNHAVQLVSGLFPFQPSPLLLRPVPLRPASCHPVCSFALPSVNLLQSGTETMGMQREHALSFSFSSRRSRRVWRRSRAANLQFAAHLVLRMHLLYTNLPCSHTLYSLLSCPRLLCVHRSCVHRSCLRRSYLPQLPLSPHTHHPISPPASHRLFSPRTASFTPPATHSTCSTSAPTIEGRGTLHAEEDSGAVWGGEWNVPLARGSSCNSHYVVSRLKNEK